MKVEEVLKDINPILPLLPVTHVTIFQVFEKLVSQSLIDLTSKCPLGKRPATYLFYGVPFYKVPHKQPYELDIDDVDGHAVGLLLSPEVMRDIKSELYPFDTGAKASGLYAPYFEKDDSDLIKYCVHSFYAPYEAGKLVRMFFGSNSFYVRGGVINPATIPMIKSICTNKVAELHRAKLKADVRRRAIEIIALQGVPWNSEKFVFIGPKRYLQQRRQESVNLDNLLSDSTKATVIEYNEIYPFSPTSDCRVIIEKAVDWLANKL